MIGTLLYSLGIGNLILWGILLFVSAVYNLIYTFKCMFNRKTLYYHNFDTIAEVSKKECQYDFFPVKEYNVFLMCEGEEYCFEDKALYDSVNIGDTIPVVLHKECNKKNGVKRIYITI